MSIYRMAFIESLNGLVPADAIKSLADTYEATLAKYAAGEYVYVGHMNHHKWTEHAAQVQELRTGGASIREIAKRTRVSRWIVRKILASFPPTNLPAT